MCQKGEMIKVEIGSLELAEIGEERYRHPSPLIQKRLHTLYLKAATQFSHEEIAQAVGIHRDTVTRQLELYNEVGLAGYCKTKYKGQKSDLDTHTDCLLEYFEKNPPHSIKQATQEIEKLVGIKRSETQVRYWLKKKGLGFVKSVKSQPKPTGKPKKPL